MEGRQGQPAYETPWREHSRQQGGCCPHPASPPTLLLLASHCPVPGLCFPCPCHSQDWLKTSECRQWHSKMVQLSGVGHRFPRTWSDFDKKLNPRNTFFASPKLTRKKEREKMMHYLNVFTFVFCVEWDWVKNVEGFFSELHSKGMFWGRQNEAKWSLFATIAHQTQGQC